MRLSNEAGMRSQARYGALLVRISDPLSRLLRCARGREHVRVIPARLLNFGSHKVVVYGYFSVVNHKAVWHFTVRAFVIFVNVSARETGMEKVLKDFNAKVGNVRLVT